MYFPTFRLDGYGPTDGRTDGGTDKASYRVACPQLKRELLSCYQDEHIFLSRKANELKERIKRQRLGIKDPQL